MADYSRVFALRLIWRLLINAGSFGLLGLGWISCDVAASGMWVIDMQAPEFGVSFWKFNDLLWSYIGDGKNILFWFDIWLNMGHLIGVSRESSTRVMWINWYASVSTAASYGQWNLRWCQDYHLRKNYVPHLICSTIGRGCMKWSCTVERWRQWLQSLVFVYKNLVVTLAAKQWSKWSDLVWFGFHMQFLGAHSLYGWLSITSSRRGIVHEFGVRIKLVIYVESRMKSVITYSLPVHTHAPFVRPIHYISVTTLFSPRHTAIDMCPLH